MPAVKRKTKKKTGSSSRGRRKKPLTLRERIGAAFAKAGSIAVTYCVVGLTAAAAIVVLMLFAGGYFWNIGERFDQLTSRAARMVGFEVNRISVRGASQVPDWEILSALWDDEEGGVLGKSLLHLDPVETRHRIEGIGWVQEASVQKLWPDTLHISVVERRPIALWPDLNGQLHAIDRDGVVLSVVSPSAYTSLPVVTGLADPAQAAPILTALLEHPTLLAQTTVINLVEGRRFDLRFEDDFVAHLPEDDIETALERLEGIGVGNDGMENSLSYIDLRDARWAFFEPKSG